MPINQLGLTRWPSAHTNPESSRDKATMILLQGKPRAEELPVLVMLPWRRRAPEESCEGTRPRYPMSSRALAKRDRSPNSATRRTA